MKKLWKNTPYFQFSLYAIFVIIVSILFYRISSNTDNIVPSIMNFIGNGMSLIAPILYGLLIAYLFNPIMDFFETYLLKWLKPSTQKQKKFIRLLSIWAVYISIIGTVFLMFRYLIPQILDNIKQLTTALPSYLDEWTAQVNALETAVNQNLATFPYHLDIGGFFDNFNPSHYVNKGTLDSVISTIFSTVTSKAVTFGSSIFNWIMGLVIAFYILSQKEAFAHASKRLTYSLFNRNLADRIIAVATEGHETFIQFFIGKFIDSLIIGIICFVGLSLLRNPYAILLSLIVGVFNMIPYFGPFLGAIPAIIITLFTGFMPAVLVAVFIIILQQFDGLVLGPKILGDSIGISPFWIISGVLVGGALWGPLGMFFASPIIAVTLRNLNRWMDRKLDEKNIIVTSNDSE